MPDVNFAANAYNKTRSGLRPERCENFMVERSGPQSERTFRLVSRPGLKRFSTAVSSKGRGMAFMEGVIGNKVLFVAGAAAYTVNAAGVTTNIGIVNGNGPVDIAVSRVEMVIVNNIGEAYVTDGVTVQLITDPDLPPVSSATYINGSTIFSQKDTDTWYWSDLLLSSSVDALNFATAERKGDPIVKVIADRDEVWFIGTRSSEVHQPSGDDNLPFVRLDGVDSQKGAASRDSVVAIDGTIYWAGHDRMVYRASGYTAQRISTVPIDDDLQAMTEAEALTIKSFGMIINGHSLYIMTLPNQWTFAYDAAFGQWQKWNIKGHNDFPVTGYAYAFGRHLVCDDRDGSVYELTTSVYDDDGIEIERRATANVPMRNVKPCYNFIVDTVKGVGNTAVTDPQIMMRYSDDQGRTWSSERWRSLGKVGNYAVRIVYRALGRMRAPGREFEIKVTDSVNVVILGARINNEVP